jgi:hypothetical protein
MECISRMLVIDCLIVKLPCLVLSAGSGAIACIVDRNEKASARLCDELKAGGERAGGDSVEDTFW